VNFNLQVEKRPTENESPSLTFTRVCDASRRPLSRSQQSEFPVSQGTTQFIPRGVYAVSFPAGYQLSSGRASIKGDPRIVLGLVSQKGSVDYRQDQFYSEQYQLQPSTTPNPSSYKKIPVLSVSNGFIVLSRDLDDKFALDQQVALWSDPTGNGDPNRAVVAGLIKIVSLDSNRAIGIPVSGDVSNSEDFALIERPQPQIDYNCRTANLDL
jgi:hypothetical protein